MSAVFPSVPAMSAKRLLEAVQLAGGAPELARHRAGLGDLPLEQDDTRVPLAAQYQLWELAVDATHDRALPIRIARDYDVHTYEVLGFACATAPDLATAYVRLARFLPLWVAGERAELLRAADGARLLFHHDLARTPGRDLAAESSLAKIVHAGRRATGRDFAPASIALAHPHPENDEHLRAFFRCSIRYDAPVYEIALDREVLDLPLQRADPQLSAFFERQAEKLLGDADSRSTVARVRTLIADALPSGPPTEAHIAPSLGCSARTMRRRLADEGTTYREVLDDVRRILAEGYLGAAGMSVAETAFLVGFSDVANFHRAFRRWTGATPGEFRQART